MSSAHAAGQEPGQAMEAEATNAKPKIKQLTGSKLGVQVGKRGQATKNQRKRKLKKLEKVRGSCLRELEAAL